MGGHFLLHVGDSGDDNDSLDYKAFYHYSRCILVNFSLYYVKCLQILLKTIVFKF
jgi:hypothetical protein